MMDGELGPGTLHKGVGELGQEDSNALRAVQEKVGVASGLVVEFLFQVAH